MFRSRRHERLIAIRRGTAAVGIGDIEARAGQLISLRPRQRADGRLQWAAGTIGEAVIEDTVARADRGFAFAGRIPCQADSRHELLVIDRGDSGGNARVAREEKSGRRVGINLRLLARFESVEAIADFGIRRVDFIAQPVIQREIAAHAPFILRIDAGDPLPQTTVKLAAALEELY